MIFPVSKGIRLPIRSKGSQRLSSNYPPSLTYINQVKVIEASHCDEKFKRSVIYTIDN